VMALSFVMGVEFSDGWWKSILKIKMVINFYVHWYVHISKI
jgi:hypothetical protein